MNRWKDLFWQQTSINKSQKTHIDNLMGGMNKVLDDRAMVQGAAFGDMLAEKLEDIMKDAKKIESADADSESMDAEALLATFARTENEPEGTPGNTNHTDQDTNQSTVLRAQRKLIVFLQKQVADYKLLIQT